jgi:hypothetical protein
MGEPDPRISALKNKALMEEILTSKLMLKSSAEFQGRLKDTSVYAFPRFTLNRPKIISVVDSIFSNKLYLEKITIYNNLDDYINKNDLSCQLGSNFEQLQLKEQLLEDPQTLLALENKYKEQNLVPLNATLVIREIFSP